MMEMNFAQLPYERAAHSACVTTLHALHTVQEYLFLYAVHLPPTARQLLNILSTSLHDYALISIYCFVYTYVVITFIFFHFLLCLAYCMVWVLANYMEEI